MKDQKGATIIAATALIALAFMYIMTASQGQYWQNPPEVDEYIIKITEGSEDSYLNPSTPTAMVVVTRSNEFTTKSREVCDVVDNGYIIVDGRKVAKATKVYCKEVITQQKIEPEESPFARLKTYKQHY